MRELLLNVFCFACGAVIVYRGGEHVEMMRWTSNHLVRLAYLLLVICGAALMFSALDPDPGLRHLGLLGVVSGVALLAAFDRRSTLGPHENRRLDRPVS